MRILEIKAKKTVVCTDVIVVIFSVDFGIYGKMKRASIIETLAQNEGAGNITAMGAGLGMAMGVGSTIGNMANQVFQNAPEMQNMQSYEDPIVVLEKLKKLLAAGLITEEDYDTKKKEVLSRM